MNNELFKDIKLLLLDVDGILTDGGLTYGNSGEEFKTFSTKDGLGIRLLIDSGIPVGVVTARESEIVKRRCNELGISPVYQNIKQKNKVLNEILKDLGLKKNQICYMGDDLIDLPLLKLCGVSVTVPEACIEVKNTCNYITEKNGGKGAVREVCEAILKGQNKWNKAIEKYTG